MDFAVGQVVKIKSVKNGPRGGVGKITSLSVENNTYKVRLALGGTRKNVPPTLMKRHVWGRDEVLSDSSEEFLVDREQDRGLGQGPSKKVKLDERPAQAEESAMPSSTIALPEDDEATNQSVEFVVQTQEHVVPATIASHGMISPTSDSSSSSRSKSSTQTSSAPHTSTPSTTSSTAPIPKAKDLWHGIDLPAGVAGAVAKYLIEENRPIGLSTIVQKFKENYTRTQVETALQSLLNKNLAQTLEEAAGKLYWANQTLVLSSLENSSHSESGEFESLVIQLQKSNAQLQAEVKDLITAPSDEQLKKSLEDETRVVESLRGRAEECRAAMEQARASSKPVPAEDPEMNLATLQEKLNFFSAQTKTRKARVMRFLDAVSESKGLKPAARRELMEKIGIENDPPSAR